MDTRIQRLTLTAFAGLIAIALLYLAYQQLCTGGEGKRATAANLETALGVSPVAVIGKVVPGAKYRIEVTKVLKGNVKPGSNLQVNVKRGDSKAAVLREGESYIFALAPSSKSVSSYYGMIEPFIFQWSDDRIVAVTNDLKLKDDFEVSALTEAELIAMYKKE